MRRPLALLAGVVLGLVALGWLWPQTAPSAPPTAQPAAPLSADADAAAAARAAREVPAEPPQVPDGGVWLRIVSSATGEPLPGAAVVLSTSTPPGVLYGSGHSRVLARATTDARGYAVFEDLSYPWIAASVELLFYDAHGDFTFRPNTTRAIDPLPPWHGLVLDAERRPVAGARIASTKPPVVSTTSGADGSFRLDMPAFDWLVAEKDGALGTSEFLSRARLDGRVEIVLGRPQTASARVTDRAGKPLADVEATLTVGTIVLTQRTGGDGVWTWPVLKNADGAVTLRKSGYLGQRHTAALDSPRAFRDAALSRGATVAGTVVNPDRTPVPGARVVLVGSSPAPLPDAVQTDARGRFSISGVGAETLTIAASLDDRDGETTAEIADDARTTVEVVLRPMLTDVRLEVTEVDGGSVYTVRAVATPIPDTGWKSEASPMGEIGLCRGRFRLVVRDDEDRVVEQEIDVDPRPDMPPIRVVLPPLPPEVDAEPRTPTALKVRVRTPEGAPVAGAEVSCVDGEGLTDAQGLVELEANLRERDWPLHVTASLGEATGVARPTSAAGIIDVTLRPRRTLRGRVLGQLPPGKLTVTYRSATQNRTAPLLGNSFAIEGVDAVRTFVCVRHDQAPGQVDELGCAVVEGAEEAVIEVGPKGMVELTAVDAAGKPLEDPLVYVDRMSRGVEPGPDGTVRLEVSPGSHVIVLNATGSRARFEARFSVRPGATTQLGTAPLR